MAPRLRCATRERRVRGRPAPGRAPPRPAGLNSRLVWRGWRRRRTCRGRRLPVFRGRRFPCTRRHRGVLHSGNSLLRTTVYANSIMKHRRRSPAPSPFTGTSPFPCRRSGQRPACERPGRACAAWPCCAELEKGDVPSAARPRPPSVRRSVQSLAPPASAPSPGNRRTPTTTPKGLSTLCPSRRSCAT